MEERQSKAPKTVQVSGLPEPVASSPRLQTLIPDIYAVVEQEGPIAKPEQVKSLADSIAAMLMNRLSSSPSPRKLRMSEIGTRCTRQLWYKHNKPECGEPLNAQAKLNFLAGDIWEEIILWFAELAGHKVEGRQDTITVAGIEGHRDAIIDGVLVDVKTANSRSIEKFEKHQLETDDPFGYLDQLGIYLEGSQNDDKVKVKKEFAFLAVDKERGKLVLDRYKAQPQDFAGRVGRIQEVLRADSPPSRSYGGVADGGSGNETLGVACRYCPYRQTCWADANGGRGLRGFVYSTGIKWFTKVVKVPKVDEVSTKK